MIQWHQWGSTLVAVSNLSVGADNCTKNREAGGILHTVILISPYLDPYLQISSAILSVHGGTQTL